MGGVDLMDRLLASYRPRIRGKKWWWPLFVNVLNVSVVASWRLHCALSDSPMDHLSFRRDIAMCLMKTSPAPRKNVGGGHVVDIPGDVRYDGVGHDRVSCNQGKCHVCRVNTRIKCSKCAVRLHTDRGKSCWKEYHTCVASTP